MALDDRALECDAEAPLHPGRPRSASADAAILTAAVELLGEVGYRAMAMEAVAGRAHVSKATVYRRYPDKESLVTGVLAHLGGLPPEGLAGALPVGSPATPLPAIPPLPGTPPLPAAPPWPVPGNVGPGGPASAREMLAFSLRMASRAVSNPSWLPILGAMLAEAHHEGGLADAVRTRVFEPADAAIRAIVDAGIASGELSPTASAEAISDVLFGSLVARSMLRKPITDEWIDEVVESLVAGIAA